MRRILAVGIVAALVTCGVIAGCRSSERVAEQHYRQGLAYKQQQEYTQAAREFHTAISQFPQHLRARIELARLFCGVKNFQQAVKVLLPALEHDDTTYAFSALLGYAYERVGQRLEAERWYERAIQQNPQLVDVRLRLADLLESLGKRQEAAEVLREVLEKKSTFPERALLHSRALLLSQPPGPENSAALADLYVRHGHIARGVEEFRKVYGFAPENPDDLVRLGIFCLDREQYRPALDYLRKAKACGYDQRLKVRSALGKAYEHLGLPEEAIQEYQAALQIRADWHEGYLKLNELLQLVGRPAEAADYLEHLFHASRTSPHLTLGAGVFPDVNSLWAEILRLRNLESRKTVLSLTSSNGQYPVINAMLNKRLQVKLMVEERAEYTVLSERLASFLGIQLTPNTSEVHFHVHGQTYAAPLVNLPSLQVGGLEVRNTQAVIWNLSQYPDIDGVLGKTYLKHFNVEINYRDGLFILTKTRS